jgi:hypothetical protein
MSAKSRAMFREKRRKNWFITTMIRTQLERIGRFGGKEGIRPVAGRNQPLQTRSSRVLAIHLDSAFP